MPTQEGPHGLRFDFNDGCRVQLPESEHPWRVRLTDLDTGNILFETEIKAGRVSSTKRYYVRFRVEVWQNDETAVLPRVLRRRARGLIQFPVGTLGDPIGWFPYAVKFQEQHGCRLTCAMGEQDHPAVPRRLSRHQFRDPRGGQARALLRHLQHRAVLRRQGLRVPALRFPPSSGCTAPPATSWASIRPRGARASSSTTTAGRSPSPTSASRCRARRRANTGTTPTAGARSSRFLKEAGYRVVCIDQKPMHGHGLVWNHIPNGAEDETGDGRCRSGRAGCKHAEFFVGLSSGLSWLAWAAGTPVVMIAGFTHPTNEFATPYRVINYHTCNSCWNDPAHRFDHKDFLWCPRHKDTPRQFECTRLITVDHVKATIRRIPGFGKYQEPKP